MPETHGRPPVASWWLFAAVLLGSWLMSLWWIRFVPMDRPVAAPTVGVAALPPSSIVGLQLHRDSEVAPLTALRSDAPGNGAARWRWVWPDGADAIRVTGQLEHRLTHHAEVPQARGYLWIRQPAERPHPQVFPAAEFRDSGDWRDVDTTVTRLPDAGEVELMLGMFRTSGTISMDLLQVHWLLQRPGAAPLWWALLAGWVVWLGWLASGWWRGTPASRRWVWPLMLAISTPLLFSYNWLTSLRLLLQAWTGIDLARQWPGNLAIGEVGHWVLFWVLAVCTGLLMRQRPLWLRLAELTALATATEFVQEYIPGRSLKLEDWATNMAGISAGVLFLGLMGLLSRQQRETSP